MHEKKSIGTIQRQPTLKTKIKHKSLQKHTLV